MKRLHHHSLIRAMGRKHKSCPIHGRRRIVCTTCTRTYCILCHDFCPHCQDRIPSIPASRNTGREQPIDRRRKERRQPPQIVVPPRFRKFQEKITADGMHLQELHPDHGTFYVQVMVPTGKDLPDIKWSGDEWHGYVLASPAQKGDPVKGGRLVRCHLK